MAKQSKVLAEQTEFSRLQMALSTQDAQAYQQAVSAYINGSYEEAAATTERLIETRSDDPNLRLLLGHVYCCLQRHDMAREHYQIVLELTSDPELVECTNNSLREINQLSSSQEAEVPEASSPRFGEIYSATDMPGELTSPFEQGLEAESQDTEKNSNFTGFDSDRLDLGDEVNQAESDPVFVDPFSSKSASSPNIESSARNDDTQTPVDVHSLRSHPVDVYDDLGELPDFDLIENLTNQSDHQSAFTPNTGTSPSQLDSKQANLFVVQNEGELSKTSERQSSLSDSSQITSTPIESQPVELQSESRQGVFARLENTSPKTRQLLAAIATGIISALAVIAVSQFSPKTSMQQRSTALSKLAESGLAAAAAGTAGGVTTFTLGRMTTNRIKRATNDLQTKFDAVIQGDFQVQATIHSQDELGQLAASFNQMIDVINQKTGEARRKADEQEMANEDLSPSDLTR